MTQIQTVLDHLTEEDHLTPHQAFSMYSITRLASAIHDLRERGHPIDTELVKSRNGTSYARYRYSG